MKSPKKNSADPQQGRQCEMFEVGETGEGGADSSQHRDKSCSNADPQGPRGALFGETVPAVRQRNACPHGKNQQREAADEQM